MNPMKAGLPGATLIEVLVAMMIVSITFGGGITTYLFVAGNRSGIRDLNARSLIRIHQMGKKEVVTNELNTILDYQVREENRHSGFEGVTVNSFQVLDSSSQLYYEHQNWRFNAH